MKAIRLLLTIPLAVLVLFASAVLIVCGTFGEFVWGDE